MLTPGQPNTRTPRQTDRGEALGTIRRGENDELRIVLDEFEGHPFVSLGLWTLGRDGEMIPVRTRCVTVRVRELNQVIGALERAARRVGRGRRSTPRATTKGQRPGDDRPQLPGLDAPADETPGDDCPF